MISKRIILTIVFLLISRVIVFAQPEDMIIYRYSRDTFKDDKGKERTILRPSEVIYLTDKKMKIVDSVNKSTTIIDLEKGLAWLINMNKKTYKKISIEQRRREWESQKKKLLDALKAAKKIENPVMRKSQIKLIKKNLEKYGVFIDKPAPKVVIKNISVPDPKVKYRSGFKCEHKIVYYGKKVILDVWVCKRVTGIEKFTRFYAAIRAFLPSVMDKIKEIRGFPIFIRKVVIDLFGKEVKSLSLVKKIKYTKLKDEIFKLPEGLKEEK